MNDPFRRPPRVGTTDWAAQKIRAGARRTMPTGSKRNRGSKITAADGPIAPIRFASFRQVDSAETKSAAQVCRCELYIDDVIQPMIESRA